MHSFHVPCEHVKITMENFAAWCFVKCSQETTQRDREKIPIKNNAKFPLLQFVSVYGPEETDDVIFQHNQRYRRINLERSLLQPVNYARGTGTVLVIECTVDWGMRKAWCAFQRCRCACVETTWRLNLKTTWCRPAQLHYGWVYNEPIRTVARYEREVHISMKHYWLEYPTSRSFSYFVHRRIICEYTLNMNVFPDWCGLLRVFSCVTWVGINSVRIDNTQPRISVSDRFLFRDFKHHYSWLLLQLGQKAVTLQGSLVVKFMIKFFVFLVICGEVHYSIIA